MRLHKSKKDFENLINIVANSIGILPFYVEKDYWVTYILKRLSESPYNENIVFKGGTSLSKGYKVINRFSEDIDLQLIKEKEYSNLSQSGKKDYLKKIENFLTVGLEAVDNHVQISKNSNIRKTVYEFQSVASKEILGQVSDVIILEINTMSNPEPYEKIKIQSYITDYLEKTNKNAVLEFELESFEVNILNYKRTFVEKIFAVLDQSLSIDPINDMKKYIRHFYDIYMLYRREEIKNFFESELFYEMASKVVVENDFFGNRKNYIYSNSCLSDKEVFDKLKNTYTVDFAPMVFDELPKIEGIEKVIQIILEKIKYWEKNYR